AAHAVSGNRRPLTACAALCQLRPVGGFTSNSCCVARIGDRDPWILHLEFQTGRDATLGDRMLQYNVLLRNRHSLPVRSVLMLMRRQARGRGTKGSVEWKLPDGELYLAFKYPVIRVWEFSPESLHGVRI
ncbi:MAG: hypothetical protein NT069_22495, partial [Planctomycetota bacterium]|nr:hypothetical protein [Planctomycetota bacterium]